ncbi:2'-5' RNA ligase family protein [Kytococcus sedentarius]|uniref:2'-5' RNA ligase family protein n=1 Tax=Kytococcus sedentarius TaxID=1276 RepID=UPI000962C1D1|nr:2'-5' RNA ligase [Kytococcus sp. CUA-901]
MDIGVAIPVPSPWGDELRHARLGFGDEQARAIPTHITLVPPFTMPRAARGEVADHLAAAAAATRPFTVELRGTATFRPVSPVVFTPLVRGIAECEQLERRVHAGPLAIELQFPYHPHVTVAHNVPDEALDRAMAELDGLRATFTVDHFTRYVSGPDGVWRPLDSWELGTGACRTL